MFHGIDILKLNLDKVEVNEKDFVIINATHQYIAVVEVKNHLGAGVSIGKSIIQLREAKDDLETWFGTEGLEHWRFIPLIYTEKLKFDINCSECKRFVIVGKILLKQLSQPHVSNGPTLSLHNATAWEKLF